MKIVKYIKDKIELLRFSSFNLKDKSKMYSGIARVVYIIEYIYISILENTSSPPSYITIKLKDIDCPYSEYSTIEELVSNNRTDEPIVNYRWDLLRESIKKNKNLRPIEVVKHNGRYRIVDGKHRYIVLKDLYGEEYETIVRIYEKYKTSVRTDGEYEIIVKIYETNLTKD